MTKKPIVSIVVDQDDLDEISKYQHENMMKSQSKAINKLIMLGLEKEKQTSETEKRMLGAIKKLNAEGCEYLLDFADILIKSKKFQ